MEKKNCVLGEIIKDNQRKYLCIFQHPFYSHLKKLHLDNYSYRHEIYLLLIMLPFSIMLYILQEIMDNNNEL